MRYGYKQQYEVDAIADYAEIVKLLANAHPESAALQAYLSKVKLTAIMLLASEMREIGVSDIVRDRLDDCRDCERQEGIRPCMSEGLYGKCKYNSPEYRFTRTVFTKQHTGGDLIMTRKELLELATKYAWDILRTRNI